jgi:L-asparagine transporter-like permease
MEEHNWIVVENMVLVFGLVTGDKKTTIIIIIIIIIIVLFIISWHTVTNYLSCEKVRGVRWVRKASSI